MRDMTTTAFVAEITCRVSCIVIADNPQDAAARLRCALNAREHVTIASGWTPLASGVRLGPDMYPEPGAIQIMGAIKT